MDLSINGELFCAEYPCITVQQYRPMIWKLNIMAVFHPFLFIASDSSILVYQTLSHGCHFISSKQKQILPPINRYVESEHVIEIKCKAELNQIKIGNIGTTESPSFILLAVGNEGHVGITFISKLLSQFHSFCKKPLILESPHLVLNNDHESTWSLSITHQWIAVGANNKKITLWKLPSQSGEETNSEQPLKFQITSHDHNIPSICFSPCGKSIVSCSIDRKVRYFLLNSLEQNIESKPLYEIMPNQEWGWSIQFIRKESIKIWKEETKEQFVSNFAEKGTLQNMRLLNNLDSDHESVDSLHLGDDEEEEEEFIDEEQSEEDEEIVYQSNPSHHSSPSHEQDYTILEEEEEEKSHQIVSHCIARESEHQLQQHCIIYASKHHLFLLDSHLRILDSMYYNPGRCLHILPAWMNALSRLSLLEYIPELSTLLVASQSDCKVLLVRIVKNETETKFRLISECVLPKDEDETTIRSNITNSPNKFPICGITVQPLTNQRSRVYILKIDRTLWCYDIWLREEQLQLQKMYQYIL